MATVLERAAHSVDRMFSFCTCLFVIQDISRFGLGGRICVLIVPVPGHCLQSNDNAYK